MKKTIIMAGLFIGSYAGSCIPLLWGEDVFSVVSILLGMVGGIAGIYLAYKLTKGI